MSERGREYYQNYYQNIRRPKTLANRAVAAATCEICGDEWANTHAGWNAAIFVCNTCDGKLSNWDREKEMARRKMEALCQVCYVEPAISLHEASQLRCCCGCSAWLSEGKAEGSKRWEPAKANPWDEGGKLGHIFEQGAQFHEPPAVASLCGVKAPVWPIVIDMIMPAALRYTLWPMRRLSEGLPRSCAPFLSATRLPRIRCANFPGDRPGRGNQLRRSARDSQTNFT